LEALDSKDLKNKLPALVKFSQWKKIEVIEKEKKKYVTRIVEIEKDRQDFADFLADQTAEFKGHVNRVYKQYEEIKRLKENLPTNHLLVQMDFVENYSCKSVEEIQTAYRSFESKASSFANDLGLADTSIPSFLEDFKVSAMSWCLVHKHVLLLIKLVVRI
jgi:hypothetical protein